MAADGVVLTMADMIDLSIGTPEVGVVDFNMLQTVLHCIVQQLRISHKNVKLKGNMTTLTPKDYNNAQTINVAEFRIDVAEANAPEPKIITKGEIPLSAPGPTTAAQAANSILVVERVPKNMAVAEAKETRATSIAADEGAKAPHGGFKASRAESPSQSIAPERLNLVTLSKFNMLEGVVDELKHRVFGSVPTNEDILQEVRSQTNLNAIQDMWTNLNVSSRLEAAETGIATLSSLVEEVIGRPTSVMDLIKKAGSTTLRDKGQHSSTAPGDVQISTTTSVKIKSSTTVPDKGQTSTVIPVEGQTSTVTPVKGQSSTVTPVKGQTSTVTPVKGQTSTVTPVKGQISTVTPVKGQTSTVTPVEGQTSTVIPVEGQTSTVNPVLIQISTVTPVEGQTSTVTPVEGQTSTVTPVEGQTSTVEKALAPIPTTREKPPPARNLLQLTQSQIKPYPQLLEPTNEEMTALKVYMERIKSDMDRLQNVFCDTVDQIQIQEQSIKPSKSLLELTTGLSTRLIELEKKVQVSGQSIGKGDGVISDKICNLQDQVEYLSKEVAALQTGKLAPDLVKDLQGLFQLFQTVQDMQDSLKQVHETALQLAAEKQERNLHTNALLEQIELLKTIKMDREDMIEAMAEKADLRLLARKVSHDQFETACDDLSRGLEHAFGKLNMQEALWQQALDDIQREIECKLDKMELSPVKEFFNTKLRQLQENLKQMADLRREAHAAGTKKRLLRDVNCISCDANAVMAMECSTSPVAKPMHATMSMRPYLSYELDTIRKTQASNVPQRNLHDWENINKQAQQSPPKQPQKVRSETDKHICNRYCGGSHTVTTAQQRVARLGHFIKQWGPEVVALTSEPAAGDDGKMYKSSQFEVAKVGTDGADQLCTPKPRKSDSSRGKLDKPLIISAECHCLEDRQIK